MKDNKDAVARRITSTGGQLEAVEEELHGWNLDNTEENLWMNQFKMYVFNIPSEGEFVTISLLRTLDGELKKLNELNDESKFRKFLDHEDEQKRIADVFERINEARVRFEVRTTISFVKFI